MRTRTRSRALALTAAVVAAALTGGSALAQDPRYIEMDGSSTVAPLAEVAAELFMIENPGIFVTVAVSGTSGGFGRFCTGEKDMNNASRLIKESEIALCGENGIGFDAIQVANDALALLVNEANPVDCLTIEQANRIWDEDSTVMTWGDVEGLDLPEEFAALELGRQLYGPGTDSGTFDFFTEAVNGQEGRIRTDYFDIGEDDNAAVTNVRAIQEAMGYVPYSYYTVAGEGVKPLAIDSGAGCVDATLENVQNGTYTPLGRPLFVYASDTALAKPEALAFMNFTIDNADQIATLAGFVPLTGEQLEAQREKIAALVGAE
jgi:phosphate transport system substrate-binding protein